ncbi:mitogen-activated protein kinase kinase kinase YODA-like [Dorcoceras hygrometricum]|uniref:Mitogen-activated protein kinase kinase kinase YODA-like n=1 Tax=Dorcoceras hygrometricum TaxID=472368 RepID=A0A2Z7D2S6_9LAMI|nr:mitogen-activated protein kinase kinase kinase YODA-like [Dorcoceras hygrometricum]
MFFSVYKSVYVYLLCSNGISHLLSVFPNTHLLLLPPDKNEGQVEEEEQELFWGWASPGSIHNKSRLGLKETGIDQLALHSVQLGYLKILKMGNTYPNNTKAGKQIRVQASVLQVYVGINNKGKAQNQEELLPSSSKLTNEKPDQISQESSNEQQLCASSSIRSTATNKQLTDVAFIKEHQNDAASLQQLTTDSFQNNQQLVALNNSKDLVKDTSPLLPTGEQKRYSQNAVFQLIKMTSPLISDWFLKPTAGHSAGIIPHNAAADSATIQQSTPKDCGRYRQSGPRPEPRLFRHPALEALTNSARTDSPHRIGRNEFRQLEAAAAACERRGRGGYALRAALEALTNSARTDSPRRIGRNEFRRLEAAATQGGDARRRRRRRV